MKKRVVSILLVIVMMFGSIASFAAPGDIIHTGNKKVYKPNSDELINDILNGADLSKFYREIEGKKFVNVVEEEEKQLEYIENIIKENEIKSKEELKTFLDGKTDDYKKKLDEISAEIAKSFDEIPDKGSLEDYFGDSKAPILKTPENYSTPEPGLEEGSTKITRLNLPSGVSSWVYKVGDEAFTDLEIDQVIADTTPYTPGIDIEITPEKHLLLAAVDKDGRLKAYANIQITTDMVKTKANKDETINVNFTKSTKSSGATVVSGELGESTWKVAVLDNNIENIYVNSKFAKAVPYKDGIEIVVANDEEVDNIDEQFKKYIIIYSEEDGKVEKYNIFEIGQDKISEALDAKKLVKKADGIDKFNYTTPTKGSTAGTTKIETLKGLKEFSATKWMYALVKDNTAPKLDRVLVDSVDYKAGQDIPVKENDKLMLLATDDNGKVKAYAIVDIDSDMIKNPPADILKEIENYSNPEKGTTVGTTKFRFLKYEDATLYYVVSETPIDIPEKESTLNGDIKNQITPDDIKIFEKSDPILKDANGFTRYMMVYAIKDNKVMAYKDFILTKNNVRLPEADKLPQEKYKTGTEDPLKPGTRPNSTILKTLNKDGIGDAKGLKYMYKFVDKETIVDINEVIKSTRTLEAEKELTPAKIGEYLLILLVDSNNRTKYYANIELTDKNTRIDNAPILRDGKNYSNPEPGTAFSSTKFRLLGLDGIEGATKFKVATSETPFEAVEFDSEVTEAFDYASIEKGEIKYSTVTDKTDENGNILGVDAKNNKYLLLLATDEGNKVKGYKPFTLFENMIRGKEAEKLTSTNYTIDKGSKPGTIRFSKLSAFGIGNTGWMYKWAEKNEFTSNPPFSNQIITDATIIRTKTIDKYTSESIEDIKVGEKDKRGYILLLAVNGNRVVGYDVIEVKEENVQSTASVLNITLTPGSTPDSTKIAETDKDKANKYKISTTPMDLPGPNEELPRYGVMDVPESKEIQVSIGEHLRIFNVDENGKILGYKDFEIKADNIQQGTATLEIVNQTAIDNTYELLEGNIKANAIKISVELKNASWADVVNDQSIKNTLLDGLKADGKEQSEWNKVIEKVKNDKYSISINRDSSTKTETITITTTATEDYDISEEQRISLTIPARAIKGALNPIEATGNIVIKPTIDAKISGTVVNNIRQSEINSGDATIVIDIVDSKWIDNIETEENKKALLAGFVGNGGNDSSWNDLKAKIEPKNVVLKGSQKIEITIPKNDVKFDTPETITLTIPKDLVEDAQEVIVANPSFTIYPDILPVKGTVDKDKEVILEAPNYVNALEGKDTWELTLDGATFKEEFSAQRDLIITDLPTGLKLDINKEDNSKLSIKLIGKSSKSLSDGSIGLVIKASAVDGTNYSDSEVIRLGYSLNDKINLEGNIEYDVQEEGISLVIKDGIDKSKLQYSTNSTNGINGDWVSIPKDNDKVTTSLDPVTIYVRETKQTDNKVLVCKLENPDAPTGVEIETYKYDDTGLTVTLNEKDGLEYSLGKPNEWKDVPDAITLNKNSTLLVRKKAATGKEGQLPSLPTAKLNGLYLGDVKLDVSQSKIIGANSQMKYKLSNDGTWNSISGNDPIVDFKEGNEVWICEAKNDRNAKELGTVSQASISDDEKKIVGTLLDKKDSTEKGIYYHIGEKKIVNNTDINLQYNITKGEVPKDNWFDLKDKDTVNNVDFIPGNVFVRKVVDGNSLPSNPVKIFEIADPINPPTIVVVEDNKTLQYETSDGKYKPLDDKFEYKINNGEYQNGTLLATDPKRLGNVTVYVKRKATKELLASKEINFKFTENISLANVKVNVAENTIEGTTTKMEYRTDKNSPWKTANSGKTSINMYEGMSIWIRELDKPSTEKLILKDLGKMDEPGNTDLKYDVAQKYIKNASGNILEYRINDGNWNTINVGQTISIEFVPIKLSIRTKATMDKLASDVVDVIDNLGYPAEAPKVDFDDEKNKVTSIKDETSNDIWDKCEFKLKTDTEWMPANLLGKYDLSGDKIVQIRKKGDGKTLPSEIAEIVFTKNIDLGKVELRQSTPLKLLYTEPEMEYQVYLKDKPIPTTWIKATSGTTVLDSSIKSDDVKLIVIRDARNIDKKKYIGEKDNLPVDLSKVNYKISDSGIKLNGITDRIKYRIGEDGELKLSNGSEVSIDSLEPVTITLVDTNYSNNTRTIVINERAETPEITVSEVEYTTADDIKAKLTLDKFGKDTMEYSIDRGTNWKTCSDDTVEIGESDILVVRAKAKSGGQGKGKLPSLPTASLNGIFLGKVSINAENQLILDTTNSMEYSLDSNYGKGGTWKQADSPNTKVELKENDKVYIREKNNEINVRLIGTIGKESTPTSDNLSYNIKDKTITNSTNQKLEYRVAGAQWVPINANETASNVEFKAGDLEFRKVATGANLPSGPVTLVTIAEAEEAPKLRTNNGKLKDIQYLDKSKWQNIDTNLEYRVGANGEWKTGDNFNTDKSIDGNTMIYFRKVATEKALPSKETSLTLTFANLKLNVAAGKIEGTTSNMEYNLNSIDGSSGTWQTAGNGATNVNFVEGMNIWFREKDKPLMKVKLVDNLEREVKPNIAYVYYNIATGKIANSTNQNLEYRIASKNEKDWRKIDAKSDIYQVEFKPGALEFRKAGTKEKLPSLPVTKTTIKAPESKPTVVTGFDVDNSEYNPKNSVKSINGKNSNWSKFEYSIDNNPWKNGVYLNTEDLNRSIKVRIRKIATATELASQIETVDFKEVLNLAKVGLSTHVQPLELNGTTKGMEYKVQYKYGNSENETRWDKDEKNNRTIWLKCDNNNTKLNPDITSDNIIQLIIRDKNQQENQYTVYKKTQP